MEILSSPSHPALIPNSPEDGVRRVIARNSLPELRDLINSLASSASLETEKPLELAENLLRALENNSEPALTYPLTRILRLHLDLALFKHFSHRQVLPQGMDVRLKELAIPSNEVALNHELQCALKACQALSSPVEGFWAEYGGKFVEVVDALEKQQVVPSFSGLNHLRKRVSNRYADILFLFWMGRLKGPFEEIRARMAERKRDREVALSSVGILTQYAWEGSRDALEMLSELGGKGSKGTAQWPIRLSAIGHLQALKGAPDRQIAQAAETYLIERESEESHPHVKEAILSGSAIWNQDLGLIEMPSRPSASREGQLIQQLAVQDRLEDERLIAFAKNHPDMRELDLRPYRGITPQGLQEALRNCGKLETLVLHGLPVVKPDMLPKTLTRLHLGGSTVLDREVVELARQLPQLAELILDDCPAISGKGFEELTVGKLSLNNTGVTAAHLKPLVTKGSLRELNVNHCPKLDLSFLEGGSKLTHLGLRGHLLRGLSFAGHIDLTALDLAEAEEVTDSLLATLPSGLVSLNLKGSLVTAKGVETLLNLMPGLQELQVEGSQVQGEDLNATEEFVHLRSLSIDGKKGCEKVISVCPNLQKVTLLSAGKLKGKLLTKMVKKRSSLTHLSVEDCPSLDEPFIRALVKECPNLTELDVGTGFAKVEELDLEGSSFGDHHVDLILHQCPSLEEIDLSGCNNLTGSGLKQLIRVCPRLRELDVGGCKGITPDAILSLSGLKVLSYGLLASLLKAFPKIGQLDLSGCSRLDDEEIARAIQKGRVVHTLDLSDCQLGRASFKAFKEAGALESLALQNCGSLNASDLRNLAQNPNLRYLNLGGCVSVTRETSLNLEGCLLLRDPLLCTFTANLPRLEALVLKNCTSVSAEGVARAIQSCHSLHTLDLRECPQIEKWALHSLFESASGLVKVFYGQETVTRGSVPRPSSWPGENVGHLPPSLPPQLAGVYNSYYERHLGVGDRARELQRDLRCYVPLRAVAEGEDPRPLQEVIEEFLNDDCRPCLLLTGDSGAGKSLFLRSLEAQAWSSGQSNSNNSKSSPRPISIPLLIDLKGVKGREEDLPSHALSVMGYSKDQILELKISQTFLFLLDGYDELGAWQGAPLEELMAGWQGKCIVTCRTQHLDRSPDYWDDWFALGSASKYEYTIIPFDPGQIEHYVDRFVLEGAAWTKERYLEAMETIQGLRSLVTSPLVLRLVIEVLPRLPTGQLEVSRSDIYEKFVESWYQRAKKRMRGREGVTIPTLDQVYDFTGPLGYKMIHLGEFEAYADTDEWSPFFTPDVEDALELAPLRSIGAGGYQFFHKSLVEFFASQHIFRVLLMHKDHNNETLQNRHTQHVVANLESHPLNLKRYPKGIEGRGQEALLRSEPAVLDFLVDRIGRVSHRENRLLQIVLASRTRPEVATAAANAVTLLNRGGYPFSGLDLSSIHIPHASLEGAILHYTNLRGAILTGVTLTKAQLVGTVLEGADLAKVDFGLGPMLRAEASVSDAVFSTDGSRIALAVLNNTVEIWDPIDSKRLQVLKVLTGGMDLVRSVAISGDGNSLLVAGGFACHASVWDLSSGTKRLALRGHTDTVQSAAFSPDGRRVLTASGDKTARLWDLNSGKSILTLEGHTADIECVRFSPDGKVALTASWDKTARVWDLSSGKELVTLQGHRERLKGAALSREGDLALTSSEDKTARLWEVSSGRELLTLTGHTDDVNSVAFSPDGKRALTASSDATARLWDLTTGKSLLTLEGHLDKVWSAVFGPDGKVALTGGDDETARIWDLSGGKGLVPTFGHTDAITGVTLGIDGKQALTTSRDNTVCLWDLLRGRRLFRLEGHFKKVTSARLAPDGKLALTASKDKTARLWDLSNGKEILTLQGHVKGVTSAEFDPDGKVALTASKDNTARLWDLSSGKELFTLVGHSSLLKSAVFSPDGKLALTASYDETARIWDVSSGTEVLTLQGHTSELKSASFSPDGKRALTSSRDLTARLWDLSSGKELLELTGHRDWVTKAIFSPNGKLALTACDDYIARLWDLSSGRRLIKFDPTDGMGPWLARVGYAQGFSSITFSPDGSMVLTTSWDITARLWNFSSKESFQILRGHTRCVSSASWGTQNEIVTGSADRTVALWRQIDTSQGPRFSMVWRSAPTDLVAEGCLIGGAQISNQSAVLLQQKGGEGSAVTDQSNSG